MERMSRAQNGSRPATGVSRAAAAAQGRGGGSKGRGNAATEPPGGNLVYMARTCGDLEPGMPGFESTQHVIMRLTTALAILLTTGVPQGLIHALQGGFGAQGRAAWHIWRSTAAAHTKTPTLLRNYGMQLWQLLTGEHREPTSYTQMPASLLLAVPLVTRVDNEAIFTAGGIDIRRGESTAICDQAVVTRQPRMLMQETPEATQQDEQQGPQQGEQQGQQQEEQQGPQQEEQQQTTATEAPQKQQTKAEAPQSSPSVAAPTTQVVVSPGTFRDLLAAQGGDMAGLEGVTAHFRANRSSAEAAEPRNLFGGTTASSPTASPSDSASTPSTGSRGKRRRQATCHFFFGSGCDSGSNCRFSHVKTAKDE